MYVWPLRLSSPPATPPMLRCARAPGSTARHAPDVASMPQLARYCQSNALGRALSSEASGCSGLESARSATAGGCWRRLTNRTAAQSQRDGAAAALGTHCHRRSVCALPRTGLPDHGPSAQACRRTSAVGSQAAIASHDSPLARRAHRQRRPALYDSAIERTLLFKPGTSRSGALPIPSGPGSDASASVGGCRAQRRGPLFARGPSIPT